MHDNVKLLVSKALFKGFWIRNRGLLNGKGGVKNASYNELLREGIAKECARFVLPLATPPRIYMSGSVRSWVHYIDLRSAHGTQKEHMAVAEGVRSIFAEQFPTVAQALDWVS